MAHIIVLGAGLGGSIMAFEMKDQLRPEDTLTVINKGSNYSFVPSNPWVAVGWREKEEIEVDHKVVDVEQEVEKFVKYAAKFLKLKRLPKILLRGPEFSHSIHSFGHYVNDEKKIEVETTNRQIMDILRTLAHELVHFRQHEENANMPHTAGVTGSKYENEAHAVGGVIMRHWQNKHPELLQAKNIYLYKINKKK